MDNPYRAPTAELITKQDELEWHGAGGRPFRDIWFRPRATIRYLLRNDPERHVPLLIGLSGTTGGVEQALNGTVGLVEVVGFAVLGMIAAAILFHVWAFLLRWTGVWMGGKGGWRAQRTAIAWAQLPNLGAFMLMLPIMLLIPLVWDQERLVATGMDFYALAAMGSYVSFVSLLSLVWSTVIVSQGVAEAHGFSAWKGLGSVLLSGIVLSTPFLALGVIVYRLV